MNSFELVNYAWNKIIVKMSYTSRCQLSVSINDITYHDKHYEIECAPIRGNVVLGLERAASIYGYLDDVLLLLDFGSHHRPGIFISSQKNDCKHQCSSIFIVQQLLNHSMINC